MKAEAVTDRSGTARMVGESARSEPSVALVADYEVVRSLAVLQLSTTSFAATHSPIGGFVSPKSTLASISQVPRRVCSRPVLEMDSRLGFRSCPPSHSVPSSRTTAHLTTSSLHR